jgi:hypothetical protein
MGAQWARNGTPDTDLLCFTFTLVLLAVGLFFLLPGQPRVYIFTPIGTFSSLDLPLLAGNLDNDGHMLVDAGLQANIHGTEVTAASRKSSKNESSQY